MSPPSPRGSSAPPRRTRARAGATTAPASTPPSPRTGEARCAEERTSRRPSRTWPPCSAAAPDGDPPWRLRLFGDSSPLLSRREVGYACLLRLGGRPCRPGGSHGAMRGRDGHPGERLARRLGGRDERRRRELEQQQREQQQLGKRERLVEQRLGQLDRQREQQRERLR